MALFAWHLAAFAVWGVAIIWYSAVWGPRRLTDLPPMACHLIGIPLLVLGGWLAFG